MKTGNTGTANHGNALYSTTINCNVCHNMTVTTPSNDKNSSCSSCHSGAIAKGNLVISPTSTSHIDGHVDVVFANVNVKTRAQIRNNITAVPDLNRNWTRVSGYKQSGSYDQSITPLYGTAVWNAANRTCSNVACHNASSSTDSVRWMQPSTVTCNTCHSTLP